MLEVQTAAVNFGGVNVCPAGQATPAPCSQALTLNYNIDSAITLGTPKAVTQGTSNLDFTLATGATCTSGTAYSTGSQCALQPTFTPVAPGLRVGAAELTDSSGNLISTVVLRGIGQGPAIAFSPGVQIPIATGVKTPTGLAVDAAGDIFYSSWDSQGSEIVEIPAGCMTSSCWIDHRHEPNRDRVYIPQDVAVDGAGNVFYASSGGLPQAEEIPPGCASNACVSSWFIDYLVNANAVAVDAVGDVFIAVMPFTGLNELWKLRPPAKLLALPSTANPGRQRIEQPLGLGSRCGGRCSSPIQAIIAWWKFQPAACPVLARTL